ncbi:transcription factor bHLH90 [Actinidia eriantha]|uniref:transcription factor bHLH90 n=1 Tax=Actinidia eriantha TaxID=165200 RepID=UPI0025873393|nr:transcription factor bHLH90 [Actinidia eriantha]
MRALETALQWLRPLVETKAWGYCVVWKLGDDPSRYFEWVGCCCGGAYGVCKNVKEEKAEELQLLPLCRDTHIKHFVNNKACDSLAHFPSSIPLYSGVHGETVLSAEPRWLSSTKDSNSSQSHESTGTQVLIPVVGGLIELFSAKHIFKDQRVIEFVITQYKITMEQEAITAQHNSGLSLNIQPRDPLLGEHLTVWPHPMQDLNYFPRLQFLPPVSQPNHYPSFKGSSTGSNPSNEHPSFNSGSVPLSPNGSVNETIKKYPICKKSDSNGHLSYNQESEFLLGDSNHLKPKQRMEREPYHSKNLVTERNRRNRIRDGLFALRALVPKISKMDRASIPGDAIEYIEALQKTVKELKDELRAMEEEECKHKSHQHVILDLNAIKDPVTSTTTEHNHDGSIMENIDMQVEVYQIGTRDFLLKLLCKQKQGGFVRLMEALNSLGLQVIDANVSTYSGKVLNMLKVEVNKSEFQPKSLKDSLIKLVRQTYQP